MSAASYSMGLILKDEDSFAPFIQGVSLPLLLLSGRAPADEPRPGLALPPVPAQPVDAHVERDARLFVGDYGATDVVVGAVVTVVLAALLAWWGTRTFQRTSA